ncbi:MAG: exo-alpha-sialidase [Chthoniobacteraceae bacterium]|nr:exo-alpha-sialidase [Chthoniobacteraceae bacterium]
MVNRTIGITSSFQMNRLIQISAAICIGVIRAECAENKPVAAPAHAVASGVRSLDVYAEGTRVHLLTGESMEGSERPALLHRHSEDSGATWSQPVRIDETLPAAFSLHRGMDAQLAAAGDHLVAAWTTAGTDQWGSGAMTTALSEDGGRRWHAGPNPADDGSTTGHGFIDMAADNSGHFHLTWLDSRDGKQGLRYARSDSAGKSWSPNTTLKAATCECCPNRIVAGVDGELAILFRDGNPRDMQLVRSPDSGRHWLPPAATGAFDWQFNGCPHVGGGLAITGEGTSSILHTLSWTGKVERVGVYHIAIPNGGQPGSEPKQLGDSTASHPDLAAAGQGRIAAVWDSRETSGIWGSTSTDAGRNWSEPKRLSSIDTPATHPRVISTGKGFRVFWTEETAEGAMVWATAVLP